MENDHFAQKVRDLQQQVAELDRRFQTPSPEREELLGNAATMLRTSLTELQTAQEELRVQNEELEAARHSIEAERRRYLDFFESAPDGYVVTDAQSMIQEANRAAADLLRVSPKFLRGKPLVLFVAQHDRYAFRSLLTRLAESDQKSEWELSLRSAHRPPFTAALTLAVIRDRDGRIVSLRWLLRDITERRQAEEQIRTLNSHIVTAQETLNETVSGFERMVANIPGMVYQFVLRPDGSVDFPYVSEGSRDIMGLSPQEIQDDPAGALARIHSDDRAGFDRAIAASADSLLSWKWEGRHRTFLGEWKWYQAVSRPERLANGDVRWDGVLIDITERKRAERIISGQAVALAQMLNALTDKPDLDTFLGQVLAAITEALGSHHTSLWFFDPVKDALVRHMAYDQGRITAADPSEQPRASVAKHRGGLWQEMVRDRRPIVVSDDPGDTRRAPGKRLFRRGIQTLLLVPLLQGDHILGWLNIASATRRAYQPEEMELAQALAHQVTLAVQLTRLAGQGRQAAVLQERNRLAREIHDTLAQGFTGIVLQLEAAEDALSVAPSQVLPHIDRARDLARQSLAEARRSVWALRPQALEHDGLAIALKTLSRQMTLGTSVRAELYVQGTPRALPAAVEDDLLRIGLEALTNAVKHAQASAIRLELAFDPKQVRLSVQDNGRGFDLRNITGAAGLGLTGMQERTEHRGGKLTVNSVPGRGTEVIVIVPAPASLKAQKKSDTPA